MNGKWKNGGRICGIAIFTASILFWAGISSGGDLEPSAAPGEVGVYSLQDVYDRLNTGAAGSLSTATAPSADPADSWPTVGEIMGKAPAVDDTDGATASDVANGKTFWGLTSGQWGPRIGTADPGGTCTEALVPKTGQTTCYNTDGDTIDCADTGQDGDLQTGLALPSPRFTDNGDGTVTDNLTRLVWLKNANCAGSKNWADALTFANSLHDGWTGDGGDCGLSDGSVAGDWHLPSIRELHSLIDFEYYDPALSNADGDGPWANEDPFTGVVSFYYWSSTNLARYTNAAWRVYLYNGFVSYDNKSGPYYIWPVREGQ